MSYVTPAELLDYATPVDDGQVADKALAAKAAVDIAHSLIEGYCRGRHLTRTGAYKPGVRGVVLTVAARLVANPGQISVGMRAGSLAVNKGVGFQGFTLSEQLILDRYRKRAV